MKYRLAVFDMDGTILNTLGDISASVNFALRAEHMPERTMAEIRGFVGNGVRRLIELSVPSDASQEACERVYNAFAEHYRLHCADATAPYSGIVDLLSRLRAKVCTPPSYRTSRTTPLWRSAHDILTGFLTRRSVCAQVFAQSRVLTPFAAFWANCISNAPKPYI